MASGLGSAASGALSGAAAGSVVPGVGTAIGAGLGALAGYLASRKTKGQKELEAANAAQAAQIAAEQARLAGGNGGLSDARRQAAQSAVRGAAASAAQQQLADVNRGSATGASGQALQQTEAIQRAEQGGVAQGLSNFREQDLAAAAQQRGELEAMKQNLFQNRLSTTGMQQANRQQLYGSLAQAGQQVAPIIDYNSAASQAQREQDRLDRLAYFGQAVR